MALTLHHVQSSDSVAAPSHGARGHITSSQLAAALATAGAFPPFHGSGPSQASTSSGQSSSSGAVITPDMLQSALASFNPSSSSSPLMPPPPVPPFATPQVRHGKNQNEFEISYLDFK